MAQALRSIERNSVPCIWASQFICIVVLSFERAEERRSAAAWPISCMSRSRNVRRRFSGRCLMRRVFTGIAAGVKSFGFPIPAASAVLSRRSRACRFSLSRLRLRLSRELRICLRIRSKYSHLHFRLLQYFCKRGTHSSITSPQTTHVLSRMDILLIVLRIPPNIKGEGQVSGSFTNGLGRRSAAACKA